MTYNSTFGNVFYVLLYGALTSAAWLAMRRVPAGPQRRPWLLVAVTQTLWFAGDATELAYYYLAKVPPVGLSDVCWLGGYAVLTVALVLMARRRAPGRLRGAVLDALTLTAAAALVSWQFLIEPSLRQGYSTGASIIPALYPVADVVVLAALLFIALSPGTRQAPTRLLFGAVALYLSIDLITNIGFHFLSDGLVARAGSLIMLGNALLTAACLHPKRDELTRSSAQVRVLHPSRVLFLGVAFLTAPVLTAVQDGLAKNAVATLLATAASTIFVLTRFTLAVREQERAQAQLSHQAHHDPLTGLANRAMLTDEMDRGRPTGVAVLYLDLDGFKQVNDRYGHEAGDLVLTTVANRLSAAVRGTDLVVRLGGDEFVLFCPDLPAPDAIRLAERVVADVARPIPFQGSQLDVGASIGIAAYGAGEQAHERDALRAADAAMYEAKRQGRGRWVLATTLAA
ncbi:MULTISPECIES: GGDEF domain-containing protein [unclassified Actinoplanes]|uniref:GGDEF domain-containing protein n=1 Tax=unclassified Actinoplanes TaxID=2626549 RepID=UPI0002E52EFA|nr:MULTISPECIES: GGDEF domain-containing protein [unclassified Actinoplanes]